MIKFLGSILLLVFGGYIGIKGFNMPNSSAEDLCFGIWFLFSLFSFCLWLA